jgi:hypothetical protein
MNAQAMSQPLLINDWNEVRGLLGLNATHAQQSSILIHSFYIHRSIIRFVQSSLDSQSARARNQLFTGDRTVAS